MSKKHVGLKLLTDQIAKKIVNVEKRLNDIREDISDENSFSQPKLYLRGKFISFDKERGILLVLIGGEEYSYPIQAYASERIPFPNSQVLVFRNEDESIAIFGFEQGRMIAPCRVELFRVEKIRIAKEVSVIASNPRVGEICLHSLGKEGHLPKVGEMLEYKVIQLGAEMIYIQMNLLLTTRQPQIIYQILQGTIDEYEIK